MYKHIKKDIENGATYYFYNGFDKPKEINLLDTELSSNYLGDVTNGILEDLNDTLAYYETDALKDKYLNDELDYFLFRNPTKEDYQRVNVNRYGLDKNAYL